MVAIAVSAWIAYILVAVVLLRTLCARPRGGPRSRALPTAHAPLLVGIPACLLLALTGCSNDTTGGIVEDPDGTCDSRGSIPLCNDYDADDDDVSFFEMICMGTWSDTRPCDRATACGMCNQPQPGFSATSYYYAGSGPESASASQCADVGGTWIDVPDVTCD